MGTIVNAAAIILGSLIGLLLRRGIPQKVEQTAMKLLGLSTLIVGIEGVITTMVRTQPDGSLTSGGTLLLIVSLVVGGVAGELWDVDGLLVKGGKVIEKRFGKEGFAKGFISASLVFCIGAMAILGALNEGLGIPGGREMLYVKAVLDGICSVILASTLGFGVLFSFIPVLVYQGSITLFAGVLSPFLTVDLRAGICMVGYAIVLCIGINFMEFTVIRTANLLPALAIPVLYYTISPVVVSVGGQFLQKL